MSAPLELSARSVVSLYALSLGGLALCLGLGMLPLVADVAVGPTLAIAVPVVILAVCMNAAALQAVLRGCDGAAAALERRTAALGTGIAAGRGEADIRRPGGRPSGLQRLVRAVGQVETVLTAQEREVERLNHADPLTGVGNRRWLQIVASRCFAEAEAGQLPLAALLLRIDHLQEINQSFGFDAGDRALLSCSDMLRRLVRRSDPLARVSGNEFFVLLPGTSAEAAGTIVQRLTETLARFPLALLGEAPLVARMAVVRWDGEKLVEPLIARAQAGVDEQPLVPLVAPPRHAWSNIRTQNQELALAGVRPAEKEPAQPRRRGRRATDA